MNLHEFIQYRKHCPICDDPLITAFHSQKKQSFRYEEDRLIVIFRLDALKKHQINYKVGYSFGMTDNSWQAEFYSQDDIRFEKDSPEFLRTRFRELDKNLGSYKFFRHCTNSKCLRYNYSTNYFKLDYKTASTGDLKLSREYIGMASPIEDGYKIYKLHNDYGSNKSMLIFGRWPSDEIASSYYERNNYLGASEKLQILETSLIKFSSKDETMERLNKLLIFS